MYHEGTLITSAYYDTIEEMPKRAKVRFPDKTEKEMTAEEICALDEEGWYTIMHSSNWGVCDHWTSQKPSKWIKERFNSIIHYTRRNGETVGYNRKSWTIVLTRDANFWKSEVWNS